MARSCIFCKAAIKQGGAKRAVEHTLPKWIWPYLGIEAKTLISDTLLRRKTAGSALNDVAVIQELPDKAASTFVEGRVCRTCNNGWMSALEGAVMPLLIPLLTNPTGTAAIQELSASQPEILALWAVKTALVLAKSKNVKDNIAAEHYECVMKGQIPDGVAVFGGFHLNDKLFGWQSDRNWVLNLPQEMVEAAKNLCHISGYKVCLQLRSLLLLVAFPPAMNFLLKYASNFQFPLWMRCPCDFYESHSVRLIGSTSERSKTGLHKCS